MKKYLFAAGVIALLFVVMAFHQVKPLPEGLSLTGDIHYFEEEDVTLLIDRTYRYGEEEVLDHNIFDAKIDLILQAERYVLADLFLFNNYGAAENHRPLTREVTQALINTPAQAYLITDPINTVYEGLRSPHLEEMREQGVDVTITNHKPLRDSNLPYSAIHRTFFSWMNNNPDHGWLPNIFGDGRVTFRSYAHMLTFRANHRKVLIADTDDDMTTIISTANPHDASSRHTNMAVVLKGSIAYDAWRSEAAIANVPPPPVIRQRPKTNITGQLVTEQAIKHAILQELQQTSVGDQVQVGAFYLSEKDIINALINAHERGVRVEVILDPNKDSFGFEKDGVPNTQAARKLVRSGVSVRWYDTRGEQFHTKMIAIHKADGTSVLIIGSANFTRRNLDNYNLETNVVLKAPSNAEFMLDQQRYFSDAWNNNDGEYTVEYDVYADERVIKRLQYFIQERFGLGSF